MLKYEFISHVEAIINRDALPDWRKSFEIKEEAYRIVEHVYNYYPGMTKENAAQLYVWFGLRIFKDLTDKADTIADIEEQIQEHKAKIATLKIMLEAERG